MIANPTGLRYDDSSGESIPFDITKVKLNVDSFIATEEDDTNSNKLDSALQKVCNKIKSRRRLMAKKNETKSISDSNDVSTHAYANTNEDEDVLKENLRYCIIGLSIPCSILEQYLFYNGNESKYYRYVKRMGLMIDYYYDYMEK